MKYLHLGISQTRIFIVDEGEVVSYVYHTEIRGIERAVYCFRREVAAVVWRSKMAATKRQKAKALFLYLT